MIEKKRNKIKIKEIFNNFVKIISKLEIIIDKHKNIMNKGFFKELIYENQIIDSIPNY